MSGFEFLQFRHQNVGRMMTFLSLASFWVSRVSRYENYDVLIYLEFWGKWDQKTRLLYAKLSTKNEFHGMNLIWTQPKVELNQRAKCWRPSVSTYKGTLKTCLKRHTWNLLSPDPDACLLRHLFAWSIVSRHVRVPTSANLGRYTFCEVVLKAPQKYNSEVVIPTPVRCLLGDKRAEGDRYA